MKFDFKLRMFTQINDLSDFIKGTVVFKISTDDRLRIELFDHDGFRINPEKFTEMFSNYSRCGCFIVHLKVRIDSSNEPIITQYVS